MPATITETACGVSDFGRNGSIAPMQAMPNKRFQCVLALVLLCLLELGSGVASERVRIRIGAASQPGWSAEGLQLELDLRSSQGSLRLERLHLMQPVGELRQIVIQCGTSSLSTVELSCLQAHFQAQHSRFGQISFRGDLRLHRQRRQLTLTVLELPLASGHLSGQLRWQDGAWSILGQAEAIDLTQAADLLAEFMTLPAGTVNGSGQARYQLRGQEAEVISGRIEITASDAALSSSSGRIATEGLALTLGVSLQKRGAALRFLAEGSSSQGQLYVEPVFIDTGEHPLTFKAMGRWAAAEQTLRLTDLRLHQPGVLAAEATLDWRAGSGLQQMSIWLRQAQLPDAYQLYVQPFLIGSSFDSLDSSGQISGLIQLTAHGLESLRLTLQQLELADNKQRFRLHQLGGVLRWQKRGEPGLMPTELHWSGGALGEIAFGAMRSRLLTQGAAIELLEPLHLPVQDGALDINLLRLEQLGAPNMRLQFDAALSPIQLRPISRALGWPEFGGVIAGRLPSLRYHEGRLTLGGRLEIAAFDGHVHVENLQVEQPLGRVPRLSADIAIEQLDLRALTETFSFGRIEGRLSGRIDRLRLVNWQPASFDAHFYTPPGDRSRHRISQRAIQNISSIGGGGAAGLLSRGFLSFFKDFSYDRIGLRCILREDVCLMSGIQPAEHGGYYIVIGRFLPRVDVIGFQRQVSWPTLVEQLRTVIDSEGPVVR